MSSCHAVIVTAAGSSRRFNESCDSAVKKEFLTIGGEPILAMAIRPFLQVTGTGVLAVTYRDGDLEVVRDIVSGLTELNSGIEVLFVKGGATRQESVFNALKALTECKKCNDIKMVSIHDGARPFVTSDIVKACLDAADVHGGACPCIRITDTIVKVGEDGLLCGRLSRDGVCTVQTPQTFRFPDIYEAHLAAKSGKSYTDDTEIFMDWGGKVVFVQGSSDNRKITYSTDLR
ncbi:MAG: 2-C-methyl-D-erythritol 4-phosphate cytidylyltransferase [Spirochaetales bacterium]|nr:2-C-methyl-D-erythritol 4-phosphate cytidylyltransferase [Spirochaetales bacterium]